MDDNRKKALAAALGQIEKQFGKGSVMRLGDAGSGLAILMGGFAVRRVLAACESIGNARDRKSVV